MKAHPEQDEVRRERGYALARASTLTEALRDLNWYVEKHASDAIGWFELAVAESVQQKDQALAHLERALELDPQMVSARFARTKLLRQEGKYSQALTDLRLFLHLEPENYLAWEEMGEAALGAGRTAEALSAFAKAATLAPQEAQALWRYGRALMRAGQKDSAEKVLAQVKSLGTTPEGSPRSPSAGLDSFGNVPARLATMKELAAANPADWRLKLRLGEELLAEGNETEALEVFQEIKASEPEGAALGE